MIKVTGGDALRKCSYSECANIEALFEDRVKELYMEMNLSFIGIFGIDFSKTHILTDIDDNKYICMKGNYFGWKAVIFVVPINFDISKAVYEMVPEEFSQLKYIAASFIHSKKIMLARK